MTTSRSGTVAGKHASVTFSDTSDWGAGFVGSISIADNDTTPINGWTLEFQLANQITNIWNAVIVSHVGTDYVIKNASYDATIAGSGGTASFGFQASSGNPVIPTAYTLNGQSVAASGPPVPPSISTQNVSIAIQPGPGASSLLPAGFLSTRGNQIVGAAGQAVKIAAVNWSGFETANFAPDGLWARNYRDMMRQMVSLGFNTIRLPFSLQLFASNTVPSGINYNLNPGLQGLTSAQVMDQIVACAGQIGLKIILDDHRSAAGPGPNADGLWYDSGYTEQSWLNTWVGVAKHYAGNSTIIGADLSNEPHGAATWGDGSATDWEAAATRAGDAIQAVSPNWLMLVEGIQTYNGSSTWWGGNLQGVAAHPVTLTVPDKVVYSPHEYPSSVSSQPWFGAPNYPNNLPAVWNTNWGYIFQNNIAPVMIGEFGTLLQSTSDQQWLAKLVDYLGGDMNGTGQSVLAPGQQGISWAYWEWNPNSGDTGGILQNDWTSVNQNKVTAIAPIEYKSGTGSLPTLVDFTVSLSQAATTAVAVHYATVNATAIAGIDYTATSGTLAFAPGQVTATVPTTLLDPKGMIGSRTFLLDLSTPSNATLATTAATATLVYGTPAGTPRLLSVTDTTTAQTSSQAGTPYTGPVTGLQDQYINLTHDNLSIGATTPGWFLHGGSGNDAISVSDGTNVIDGGGGSNFLVGGSGTDTFYLDDQNATSDLWSTVVNFHGGDGVTIWGVSPSVFARTWQDGQGTPGYTGLTLVATAPSKPAAALTLVGFTKADLSNGRLSVSFGTDQSSSTPYMYIHANN